MKNSGMWVVIGSFFIIMAIFSAMIVNSVENRVRSIIHEKKDTVKIRYDGWSTIVDSISFKKRKGKADTIIVRFYKNQDSVIKSIK